MKAPTFTVEVVWKKPKGEASDASDAGIRYVDCESKNMSAAAKRRCHQWVRKLLARWDVALNRSEDEVNRMYDWAEPEPKRSGRSGKSGKRK